jgi:methyl-accepting chemotaxis protein
LVVSVTLAGVVAKSTLDAHSTYQSQVAAADLAQVDKALFNALLSFRSERGDTGTALQLPRAAAAATMESVKGSRAKVDAAMADAVTAMADVEASDLKSSFGGVTSIYDRVVTQRKQIDDALTLDPATRSSDIATQSFGIGSDYLVALEKASVSAENAIREADPSMVALVQTRGLAWSARANGGTSAVIMNSPIADGRPFTGDESLKLAASDSAMRLAWGAVKVLVDHPSMPASLKSALANAEQGYFSGELAAWRANVVSKLQSGQVSPVGIDEWRPKITAALGSVAAVASLAMDQLVAQADAQKDAALWSLASYASLFALAVVIALGGMYIVIGRVVGPISRLTECMGELASGKLDVDVAGAGRDDEIGAMARSVEVFRQAAIRNKQLEDEAEGNRLAAEREKADLQARAEAEAEARLTQATGQLAAGLRLLADGDMTCEIHENFAPQFEALRADFNTSVVQLRRALSGVGDAVATVAGGSSEISEASDTLSKRTEQQAASLEETAAALEQITSNVVSTSKRTGEARDVVRDATARADKSGEIVRDAVSAMERIEASSKQISQIIGVIDEIAFQTNLLALNAGVEAARAGDAGKGFAVVAQEVRELAQRSANAAKEIKSLISNSAVAVGEGVKLVSDTGDGLTQIAELVLVVNRHMDAIATAAQEQSAGLSQINTAINHMDQATQQNAAMVEEMSAAGAGLAQESTNLKGLLSSFNLGTASTGGLRNVASQMRAAAPQGRPAAQPAYASRASAPAGRSRGGAAAAVVSDDWQEF